MKKYLSRLEEIEEKFGVRKSRTIARFDFIQSVSGFILAMFIMGHILFESSILISEELMYKIAIMFEGYYLFGQTYPIIVSFLAGTIFVLFIVHAGIAIRKFPASYKQYKIFKQHSVRMNHTDTSLWLVQVITGFIMFFAGSIHLYMMIMNPSEIGPYQSASRMTHDHMWILYSVLLVTVIVHAFIGLYRLALKWGFMEGKNTKVTRKRYKILMIVMIVFYLVIGFSAMAKYIYIGNTHDYTQSKVYKSKTIIMEKH